MNLSDLIIDVPIPLPPGTIVMWYGDVDKIPTGWALCDGTNDTPDLRNRFVVGAGSSYAKGATGGANTVELSVANLPSHSHALGNQSGFKDASWFFPTSGTAHTLWSPEGWGSTTFNTGNTGSGTAHENRPPYYALYFIMKL